MMWGVCGLVLSVCLWAIPALPLEVEDVQDPGQYLNSFLIRVEKREIAEQVAAEHGFSVLDEIGPLNMYHLYHPEVTGRSKRSADNYVNRLKADPRMEVSNPRDDRAEWNLGGASVPLSTVIPWVGNFHLEQNPILDSYILAHQKEKSSVLPYVSFAEQQITLKRVKRNYKKSILHDKQLELPIREIKNLSLFYRAPIDKIDYRAEKDLKYNDPLFSDQWYLVNEEQTGGKRNMDLNVMSAWDQGYTGEGVTVTILDDGVDHNHPDIKRNYDARISADFNDEDDDPVPDTTRSGNSHGTRCAGEVAAEAGNGVCGVGIAYDAKIGGIRILDGRVTDRLEAKALLYKNDIIDIMSASWGPHDDGQTMEGPKQACMDALKEGATKGRNNLGTIFVWATGNGGGFGDSCAADGYVSSPYSISIGSLSDEGKLPFYMEKCCSTMAVIPTGGAPTREEEMRKGKYKINVVTTDLNNDCTENFEGTSSAAPLCSGCIALILQANPRLTARDVQHIIALGARIPDVDDSWTINGAKFHVNFKYGFGLMDCSKMVELAQTWTNVPPQHICHITTVTMQKPIPSSGCYKHQFEFDGCQGDPKNSITDLEHVELPIKLTTGRRGNTEIFLTSPSGTRSVMLPRRERDDSNEGIDFTFMTVHNWGEDPAGMWTLEVCDNPGTETNQKPNTGMFISWSLRAYGFHNSKPSEKKRAYTMTEEKQRATMQRELDAAKRVVIKQAQKPLLRNLDTTNRVDTNKVAADVRNYYSFLKDISKVFTRRQLQDLGLDARDIDSIYNMNSGSRSNFENEVAEEEHPGIDYKRGYNMGVFEDLENDDENNVVDNSNYKRYKDIYDSKNYIDESSNNKKKEDDDIEVESLKREIISLWGDILDESEPRQKVETHNSYISEYYKRKKELERQKRIDSLLKEIEEYLERKK